MNHLGLIRAIEETTEHELPIINCPKCSTFWCTLFYTAFASKQIILSFAISLLASYCALWLELLEGYIDTLYLKLYDKIYKTSNDTITTDSERGNSDDSMPGL